MALYGRVKSGISLCNKLGLLSSQRSTLHRSLIAPSISQASRNYAGVPGERDTKIKVPIAMFGGTGNYASALYIAAVKANAVEKVDAELSEFVHSVKSSPITSQFIKDISVKKDVRVNTILDIAKQVNLSETTRNFLVLLAVNGRLQYVDSIAKRFADLAMAYKGEVKAIVTTVFPLPPEEENALKQTVQEMLGSGKTVKLEQKIDPSILGGIVLEFSQKVFDMSIRTRAQQMERILREPINISN